MLGGSVVRDQWYCQVDGQQYGPFSWDQLKAMAVEGRIIAESTVRRGVDQQWYPAAKVPGLLSKPAASNGSSSASAAPKAAAAVTAPSAPAAQPASKPSKPAKPTEPGESKSESESFRLVTSREKPPAVATPPSPPASPAPPEAPIISITPAVNTAPAVVAAPPVAKKAGTTVAKKNNRTLLAIAAAAGLLIVVGGGAGAWMALGGGEDSKQIAAKSKQPAAPAPPTGEVALTDAAEAVESAVESATSFSVSTAEASSDGIDPLAVATAAGGATASDKADDPSTSAPGSDAKADTPVDAAAPAEAPADGEAAAPDPAAIEAKAAVASVEKWADLSTVPGIAFNKVRIEPQAIWLASDALGEWFEPPTGEEKEPEKSIADLTAADSKLGIDTSGPCAKFVFVQIKLTSTEPRKYAGWNSAEGPAAALCDQDDNALKFVAVSDTPDVKRLGATDLEPETPVMELLVFEAPKTPIKSLKLALARNALSDKSKGYMGFAIPLEVLQNKPAYLPGIDDVKGPPGEERPPELDLKRQIEGLKKNDAFEQPPPAKKK